MKNQRIISIQDDYSVLDCCFEQMQNQRILLVCGKSYDNLEIRKYIENISSKEKIEFVIFNDFQPNPKYESIELGIRLYRERECNVIMAIGGGSAIDVAKCIKLYANMNPSGNYLNQKPVPNDIKLIAMPTTAGTGSESNRFAVIYYNGEKQSVCDESIIPDIVIFDPSALSSLPYYQRKSTMLDALCHAVESFWSIHSDDAGRQLSLESIREILNSKDEYLNNIYSGNMSMLKAANIAGRAINITKTTAGHAMCYKLTGLYGYSHGHSAALCVSRLFPYMYNHLEQCIDPRGKDYLKSVFDELIASFGYSDINGFVTFWDSLLADIHSPVKEVTPSDIDILANSVNAERLNNNPVSLSKDSIKALYKQILDK